MKRKKLVFGGENLIDPQFCHFPCAITGGSPARPRDGGALHGHPGDEALIVTAQEAGELKRECYESRGVMHHPSQWSDVDAVGFSTFGGKKLILDSVAPGYVARRQGHIDDCDIDPRELLGLKKVTKAARPAAIEEKDNGD